MCFYYNDDIPALAGTSLSLLAWVFPNNVKEAHRHEKR